VTNEKRKWSKSGSLYLLTQTHDDGIYRASIASHGKNHRMTTLGHGAPHTKLSGAVSLLLQAYSTTLFCVG